jgi:hypothetical protein
LIWAVFAIISAYIHEHWEAFDYRIESASNGWGEMMPVNPVGYKDREVVCTAQQLNKVIEAFSLEDAGAVLPSQAFCDNVAAASRRADQ